MRKHYLLATLICLCQIAIAQTTLVTWTFGTTNPPNLTATGGIVANSTKTINSDPSGTLNSQNNSGSCSGYLSRNSWANGNGIKYWQFSFTTLNYQTIKLKFDTRATTNGPRDFKVQYNIVSAGSSYSDLAGATYTNSTDNLCETKPEFTLPSVCDSKTEVFVRLIMTSNIATDNGTVTNGGTSGIDNIIVTATTVLPIQLSDFKIFKQSDKNKLSFRTQTEQDNSHFEIERSADGKEFSTIGRVEGAGTTNTPKYYDYEDAIPLKGWSYYRLRQVDYDERYTFSKILSTYRSDQKLALNIATAKQDNLQLKIHSSENSDAILQIVDMNGRILNNQTIFLEKDENDISLDLQIPTGIYALRLITNTGEQVSKIMNIR